MQGRRIKHPTFPNDLHEWRFNNLLFEQRSAKAVRVAARSNGNQVDKRPDATPSKRHKLDNTYGGVTGVETVNAKPTQENTQQQCG